MSPTFRMESCMFVTYLFEPKQKAGYISRHVEVDISVDGEWHRLRRESKNHQDDTKRLATRNTSAPE